MCVVCRAVSGGTSWASGQHAADGRAGAPVRLAATEAAVAATGSAVVDALLDGSTWSGPITFSFPNAAGDYELVYGYDEPTTGFRSVSPAQAQAARHILEGRSAFAGGPRMALTPVEGFTNAQLTDAGGNGADIRIARSASVSGTAYAYLPGAEEGGDIWFGYDYDYTKPEVGDYAFATMIHEIGHALGLKHGHEAGGVAGLALPASRNSLEYSVMTYRSYAPSGGESAPAQGYTNERYGFPQTFMIDDIAALQAIYGADYGFRAGNTTYKWSPTAGETRVNGVRQGMVGDGGSGLDNRIFLALWDGGGTDTYDFSAYTAKVSVNLLPGGFSLASPAQRAYLGDGHYAQGNIYNALMHDGDARSLIENALGGAGSDLLKGNQAKNVLRGNAGSDILYGREGNDTLYGGSGRDAFLFTTALDRWKNVDRVVDFSVKDDTIRLDDAVFHGIGRKGQLAKSHFWTGSAAHDSGDRVIYNKANGALLYDPDGTGGGGAVKFAQLKAGLSLAAADFLIV